MHKLGASSVISIYFWARTIYTERCQRDFLRIDLVDIGNLSCLNLIQIFHIKSHINNIMIGTVIVQICCLKKANSRLENRHTNANYYRHTTLSQTNKQIDIQTDRQTNPTFRTNERSKHRKNRCNPPANPTRQQIVFEAQNSIHNNQLPDSGLFRTN